MRRKKVKTKICFNNQIGSIHLNDKNFNYGKISLDFDIELDSWQDLFEIKNLRPALKKGLVIEKIYFDGFEYDDYRDFISYEMIGNPYVENKILKGQTDIRFNGKLKIFVKSRQLFWFPWYRSRKKDSFIFSNNVHDCPNDDGCYIGEKLEHNKNYYNLPYSVDIFKKYKKAKYLTLGCSYSYGTGVGKKYIWPNNLGDSVINLSGNGIGIDTIYFNLKNAMKKFKFEKIIILFPTLERRLYKFESKGYYFKIPFISKLKNYYYISQKSLMEYATKTKKKIMLDINNRYSERFLKKIANITTNEQIYVSSFSHDTYKLLPKYFTNILPFFNHLDDGNDNPPHPGKISHKKFADSIKELI